MSSRVSEERLEEFRQSLRDEAGRLCERADQMDAERDAPSTVNSCIREFRQGQCSGAAIELRSFALTLLELAEDKETLSFDIGLVPDGVRFSVGTTKVWP